MTRLRWPHPTVRLRLALTYTALFVVTGAALLSVSYLLVKYFDRGPATAASIICTRQSVSRISANPSLATSSGTGGAAAGANPGQVEPSTGTVILKQSDCQNAVGSFYYHSSSGSASSGGAVGPVQSGSTEEALPGPTAEQVRELTGAVTASEAHVLSSFKLDSALALALITMMSFGLSWWMAGRALRPVHQITDAARTLSERTLNARINLQGPNDELKQLADTFDAMLGRLDRAFESQRRFVTNASHELRTPLATERVLIDEALANRSAGVDELRFALEQLRTNSKDTERLIDALLVLARSQRGIERWSPVDLSSTVSSVVDQSNPEAAQSGVTIETDLEPIAVGGDPGLLERLVVNLIENGIRHNHPGGSVSVTTRRGTGDAILHVANTGPPVDPAAVAGLVEPFRRAQADRTSDDGGLGLGLSIVDAIVSAHRGTMEISARAQGGLDVHVRLPLVQLKG